MKVKIISIIILILTTYLSHSRDLHGPIDNEVEQKSKNKNTKLLLQIFNLTKDDSLTFTFWEEIFFISQMESLSPAKTIDVKANKNGLFEVVLPMMGKPTYFSVAKDKNKEGDLMHFIDYYLIEPGDDVHIRIDDLQKIITKTIDAEYQSGWRISKIKFSGKGAPKMMCQFELSNFSLINSSLKIDSLQFIELAMLDKYKDKISGTIYKMLKADIIGLNNFSKIERINYFHPEINQSNYSQIDSLLKNSIFKNEYTEIDSTTILQSRGYFEFEFFKAKLQYDLMLIRASQLPFYNFILKRYSGLLKDKMLVSFLLKQFKYLRNSEAIVAKIYDQISSDYYREMVDDIKLTLLKGANAYNFSLPDSKGEIITLEQFKGKVVILDFWFTGCTGCARLYKNSLSKVEQLYKKDSNVVFITISIDYNRDMWIKEGIESGYYTSKGVVNLYTDNQGGNHPIIDYYKITGYPRLIIIDKDGKIFKADGMVDLVNYEELRREIADALALHSAYTNK